MPRSLLPKSPPSTTMRFLSGSNCPLSAMRLRTSGLPWPLAAFSTIVPPPTLERPRTGRLRRRLDLAHQRDAIAAGQDLERHRQAGGFAASQLILNSARSISIAAVGIIGVADEAGIGDDPAGERLRHAVGADFAAQARRHRQVRLQRRRRRSGSPTAGRWPPPGGLQRQCCDSRRVSASSTPSSAQGCSALSEPTVTTMPPPRGRSTLSVMLWKVRFLPVRRSSTVRLPSFNPSSRRS